MFVRRDLRADMQEFIDKHDANERRRSTKRFNQMSEEDKRKQSLAYRRQSVKSPTTSENGTWMVDMVTRENDEHLSNGTQNGGTKNEAYEEKQ